LFSGFQKNILHQSTLMKLKEKYARYTLEKKASRMNRQVEVPDMENLRKVGILWQPEQEKAFHYLHDQFIHSGVIFRNLCICPEGSFLSSSASVISQKDFNWLGLPKSGIAEDFIQMEFDLLFNIAQEKTLALDSLTALSHARFKIGGSPYDRNYFDLTIKISGEQDALYLAEQQIFYLRQLNKKA